MDSVQESPCLSVASKKEGRRNGPLSKCRCRVKGLLNGVGAGTTELHIFRQDPKLILPEYVLIFFKCPKFLNDAKEKMTGTAGQKRVPRDFVRFVPFPLPSISEQKRIVAKVDQLMHLCDELETRLNQSKKDSEMLMQAVLHEAFS